MPLETSAKRLVHQMTLDHLGERNGQGLLDDNEEVIGNPKGVHVGWIHAPSSRDTANYLGLVEHRFVFNIKHHTSDN